MNTLPPAKVAGFERIEIVDSPERMMAIGPAWTELWQRTDGLIFQSYAWIAAWWATAANADRRALRIGLVWHADRLVAVMPLTIERRRGLRFLEWAAVAYSDYGDALVAPECPQASLQHLWAQISKSGGFDIAFITRITPQAATRPLFSNPTASGLQFRPGHRVEISHRIVGTWKTGSAWYDTLSKKMRKTYRHGCNTIEKSGDLQFRLLPPEEPLEPALTRLSLLKSKWLMERGLESQLFERDTPILAALVRVLAEAGILRLFVLECSGTIVSLSVNFVQRGTTMAWVTSFDRDFDRASPGLILMTDYIKWSFDNNHHTVDFLCGGEAFKDRFATESVMLESWIGSRTWRGSLAMALDRLRRRVRAMRKRGEAA